jgi:hypothetical protein
MCQKCVNITAVCAAISTASPLPVSAHQPFACVAVFASVLLQLSVLERVVVSAGRSIDARLMAVLHSSGELSRHCQAIRRYLLMGQVSLLGRPLPSPTSQQDRSLYLGSCYL